MLRKKMCENIDSLMRCLDKNRELSAKQVMRQSFNRFDDNLFETILSFLTISDKVLFEDISKRFQKFIFNKQTELYLSIFNDSMSFDKLLKPIAINDFSTGFANSRRLKSIDKNGLKSTLKKFSFIKIKEYNYIAIQFTRNEVYLKFNY